MPTSHESGRDRLRRVATAAAGLAFLAVCLAPYAARLGAPSLYADDVERVLQLRTGTLGGILLVPFNEHIAPLFQTVSWVSWRLAGGRLARAPLAFTIASFLPFPPTLALLGWLVRRETRSTAAALASVAAFSLSWLAVETVYWYSASSFLWALLATLAAWLATASAADRGGRPWPWPCRAVAALASAAAPAFSAIGLLAGPVAAVRALSSAGRKSAALAPLAGTLVSLALYGVTHDRAALASNVGRSAGVWPGLLAAARAPAAALVPALFGLRTWQANSQAVAAFQVALTAGALVGLLLRAYRGHDRPLILGGLVLIFGGYALTFCARAGEPGRALLETQRYHLFPMLGLVLLLAPAFRFALARWDARPGRRLAAVTALAVVLLGLHSAEMKGRARFLRFPDQGRTLAAIDRLGLVCARAKVTRAQALAALDPVETAWAPAGRNVLDLLAPGLELSGVPDALVRPTLLSALTPGERQSLCGGMDATPYLRPADGPASAVAVAVGRRVALYRVREAGAGRYVSAGWPSFVEYELTGLDPSHARALGMSLAGSDPVDVWWRDAGQRWSESRSVRLRSRPAPTRPEGAWLLPLDRLPHWEPPAARRLRFLYHAPGPIAAAAPRLLR